ncbi:MAG: hypothetical protein P8X43_07550 [Maritimibacter sp.]
MRKADLAAAGIAIFISALPGIAPAQQVADPATEISNPETGTETGPGIGDPLSAIGWLSNSVTLPQAAPGEPAATGGRTPASVNVTSLDSAAGADAIGILSPATTGLPATLWGNSRPEDLARRIRGEHTEMLPALQELLYTLLLAELAPPAQPGPDRSTIFLARIDKLLEMGALDQANALLERADPTDPEIFRRWFDVSLLLGEEDTQCQTMTDTPSLSPTYQARIFCLARAGDWDGAALILGTGRALGLVPEQDAELFERFLDPDLYEGEDPISPPANPTPLTFRMYEAIGEAIPTSTLPLAFAYSDLRDNIGWKARIEAAERLARTGAVSDNALLGLFTERKPAASGGVWDRAAAIQELEATITAGYKAGTADNLLHAWDEITRARVEVAISQSYGPQLAAMELDGKPGEIALRMGLLSDKYEAVAQASTPASERDKLLIAIAKGDVSAAPATDARAQAVIDGFQATQPPVRFASLLDDKRMGEAILRAMTLFSDGASGDLDQISDALALMRNLGLEDVARRTALQYLILDRAG